MDDPSELPATCWFERSTDLQRHPAQAILSATLDALVVIDTAGAVVEWNPLATEIFGYARSETIGEAIADLIIPDELRKNTDGESRIFSRLVRRPCSGSVSRCQQCVPTVRC